MFNLLKSGHTRVLTLLSLYSSGAAAFSGFSVETTSVTLPLATLEGDEELEVHNGGIYCS